MSPRVRALLVSLLVVSLFAVQTHAPLLVAYAQSVSVERAQVLQRYFDVLEREVGRLPSHTFDTFSVLEEAGFTVEGAFAWVRDNTYLVPYQGALRGSLGVLQDRTGNSLDRTLLLQDLLDGLGYDTRLAHAELTAAQLETLLAGARAVPPAGAQPRSAELDLAEVQRVASEFGLDAAELTARLTEINAESGALHAELEARTSTQTEFLVAQIGPYDAADGSSRLASALEQHWWLQYQESGAWVDLDPTLATAQPGESLADADDTLDAFGLTELPTELVHTLDLRVVLECAVDGALTEQTLVELAGLVPADLIGQRVSVRHASSSLGSADALDLDTIAGSILEHDDWFPIITIGDLSTYDFEFDAATCELAPPSADWLGGAITRALDDIGGLFGTDIAPVPVAADAVTALRIEYDVHVPGEGVTRVSRNVFDVLGEARRQAGVAAPTTLEADRMAWRLALMGETELLATVGRLSNEYVSKLTAEALIAQRPFALALVQEDDAVADSVVSGVNSARALPSSLYALALARQQSMPPAVHFDRINLLNRHHWLQAAADGSASAHQAFDIVLNRVAASPAAPDASSQALAQGVRDTNAEALLARFICESGTASDYCSVEANAADLLSEQASIGHWMALTDEAQLDALAPAWPEDALARLRLDLRSGYTVVAPRDYTIDKGRAQWWRIDATSGEALGVDERGWGVSSTTYSFILTNVSFYYCLKGSGGSQRAILVCGLGYATGGMAIAAGGGAVGFVISLASAVLIGELGQAGE